MNDRGQPRAVGGELLQELQGRQHPAVAGTDEDQRESQETKSCHFYGKMKLDFVLCQLKTFLSTELFFTLRVAFFLKQPTSIEVEVSTYRENNKNDGFWIVQYRPFFIVGFIALHNFELLNYANKYKHIQLCNLYLDSYVILLLNTKALYVIQNVEY